MLSWQSSIRLCQTSLIERVIMSDLDQPLSGNPTPRELIEALAEQRAMMIDVANAATRLVSLEYDVLILKEGAKNASKDREKILDELRSMRGDLHNGDLLKTKIEFGWATLLRVAMFISFLFFASLELWKLLH